MLELRRLVKRYVESDLSYAQFRREFVAQFLAVQSGDQAVDAAVVEIESLCADVAEELVPSEAKLKVDLAEIVRPRETANIGIGRVVVLSDFDVQLVQVTSSTISPFAATGNPYPLDRNPLTSSRDTSPNNLTLTV